MKQEIFWNISKIIERDSKATTYKFALLRGVIDIIQDNSPFITFSVDRVHFPIGLLIEKWMMYYFPIFESENSIPQINGKSKLAFEEQFKEFVIGYKNIGGFSAFYNDLKNKGIPEPLQPQFLDLAKKINNTIIKMPMKYIGRSISNDYYSIFQYHLLPRRVINTIDASYLISHYGSFSIPRDYYEAFQVLGSFINGQDSILFKWAEFSANASEKNLSIEKIVSDILKSPITEREIKASKKLYQSILDKEGEVICVWTGNMIRTYDIDHLIPFSVWKNNDLWNLLPSTKKKNAEKKDKIPSVKLISKQEDLIIHYWNLIREVQESRFHKEMTISLLGNRYGNWQIKALEQLKNTCSYLINVRGYNEWNG